MRSRQDASRTALLLLVVLAAGCGSVSQEIGFCVGAPSGLSYALLFEDGNSINASAGFGVGGIEICADWVFGIISLGSSPSEDWSLYWGLGLRAVVLDDPEPDAAEFGVRLPLGVLYDAEPEWRAIVFFEVAPGLGVVGPDFTFDAVLGFRFPF